GPKLVPGEGDGRGTRKPPDFTDSGYGIRFFMRQIRKGKDYEEAVTLLAQERGTREAAWYREYQDEKEHRQFKRGVEGAEAYVAGGDKPGEQKTGSVTFFSDIEEEETQWLRPGWAQGTVVMVAGNSGVGKSTMLYNFIARISRGWGWPPRTDTGSYEPE